MLHNIIGRLNANRLARRMMRDRHGHGPATPFQGHVSRSGDDASLGLVIVFENEPRSMLANDLNSHQVREYLGDGRFPVHGFCLLC